MSTYPFASPVDQPGRAEIAVVVAHEQHARGVGTALLQKLGRIAHRAGLRHFVADVLAENYAMRRVIADAGWPITQHRDGSVLSVEVNLDDIDDSAEMAAPPSGSRQSETLAAEAGRAACAMIDATANRLAD